MLVPCRCGCHTDPLPYCDECCDGPASLHEQLEAAEAKLADAERERDALKRAMDDGTDAVEAVLGRALLRQQLAAAESREKALRDSLEPARAKAARDGFIVGAQTAFELKGESMTSANALAHSLYDRRMADLRAEAARAALAAGKETE